MVNQTGYEKVRFVEVASLSIIEGHGPKRVNWLLEKIKKEGIWSEPIKVEKSKMLVMDGHHRFEVAKKLGLRIIPAELFSYENVEVYSLRKNINVTSSIILKNAELGIVFPYKTAKHKFPNKISCFKGVSIEDLK